MADKLNLWPLPRAVSKDTLNMLGKVFMLHFIGTGGMALIQYLTGHWIFSFQNYYSEDAGADYITSEINARTTHQGVDEHSLQQSLDIYLLL